MLQVANTESSAGARSHMIHYIIAHVPIALTGRSTKRLPGRKVEAAARPLCLQKVAAAAPGVSAEPVAMEVALQT
jgi:hypothetical protein